MGEREAVLELADLHAWYGESHILHGVTLEVRRGEVVTLLGRNGAGRTTTLKAIMGMVGRRSGSVRFEGRELIDAASNEIARAGIAFCPEERGFTIVLVEQNFRFAAQLADRHYVIERGRVVERFAATELEARSAMLHEYRGV